MSPDSYLLKGAQKSLIEKLKLKGITDDNVLKAMSSVPRHLFIESFLWHKAYEDIPLPIYCEQTISQPYTVAFQSQLLEIKQGDKVLEIGTGSGYQAAILEQMGAKVFTIERQVELYERTKKMLHTLAPRTVIQHGDGFNGLPHYAPFNKIIVTCGAPNIPTNLLAQLSLNGIMVIPVGVGDQIMKKITKIDENNYKEEDFGTFIFVPMLENVVRN